jgi:hypothetical protein
MGSLWVESPHWYKTGKYKRKILLKIKIIWFLYTVFVLNYMSSDGQILVNMKIMVLWDFILFSPAY